LEDDPFPPIIIGSWIGRGPLIGKGKTKELLHSHWTRVRSSPFGDGKLLEGVGKNWGSFFCFH